MFTHQMKHAASSLSFIFFEGSFLIKIMPLWDFQSPVCKLVILEVMWILVNGGCDNRQDNPGVILDGAVLPEGCAKYFISEAGNHGPNTTNLIQSELPAGHSHNAIAAPISVIASNSRTDKNANVKKLYLRLGTVAMMVIGIDKNMIDSLEPIC